MRKKFLLVLVATGLLAVPSVTNAGLIGATVDVSFYFPDQTTFYCGNGSALVGAGVEYPSSCSGFGPVVIDIGDSQLSVDTGGIGWTGASFNGFLLSTLLGSDILSASYNSGTMAVTSLLVDSGNLWVNFEGQSGGRALIDFTTAPSAVPEPTTLAFLGFGLAGIAAARRRKR